MKKSTVAIVGLGLSALAVGYLVSRKNLSPLEVEISEKVIDYVLIENTFSTTERFGIRLKFDNGTELETFLNEDFKIFEGDFTGISYTVNKRNGVIDDSSIKLFLKKSDIPKFLKDYVNAFSSVEGYKGVPEIIGFDSPLHPDNEDVHEDYSDEFFGEDYFEDSIKNIKLTDIFVPNKLKDTYKNVQNLKEVSKEIKTISSSLKNILSKLNK